MGSLWNFILATSLNVNLSPLSDMRRWWNTMLWFRR